MKIAKHSTLSISQYRPWLPKKEGRAERARANNLCVVIDSYYLPVLSGYYDRQEGFCNFITCVSSFLKISKISICMLF